MRELAQTPLMLSIMTLAAKRPPDNDAAGLGNAQLSRTHLFDVYVQRMARYRSKDMRFAPSDTIAWLSWLAKQVVREGKPTFFLEDMQPTWLAVDDRARLGRRMRLLAFALLFASALPAVFFLLIRERWAMAAALVSIGLLAAAVPVLTGRFLLRARLTFRRIETVESLKWSWPWAGLGFAMGAGLGLVFGLLVARLDRWSEVPWPALLAAAGGVLLMIESALTPGDLRLRTTPGQGVEQSRRNGVTVFFVVLVLMAVLGAVAVIISVVVNAELSPGIAAAWVMWLALYLALGCGLSFGLLAWFQHRSLRRVLDERGNLPENAADFLNQAAERNLLRKVGGGYSFVHALLLDYFSKRAG
jgi:hypothetical protein